MANGLTAPNLPLGSAVMLLDTNQSAVQTFVRDVAQGNSAAALVANWFVDAAVAVPVSQQDGLTLATAFATTEQLSAALSPGNTVLQPQQPVQISLAAGAYKDFFLYFSTAAANQITLTGSFTAGPTITLDVGTTASNPATSTRGQLVTAAGAFTAGARIRVLTGPAAGSVTYGMELIAGNPLAVFVKPFFRESDSSTTFPGVGDTVQVETPTTTINRIDVNSSVINNAGGGSGTFLVRAVAGIFSLRVRSAGGLVTVSECAFPNASQSVADGIGTNYNNCISVGSITLNGYGHIFAGHMNNGTMSGVSNQSRFNASCASNAGRLSGNSPVATTQVGLSSMVLTADYELQNGAGLSAVLLGPGCQFEALGRMWGAAASPYASISTQASGSWFYYAALANITVSSVVDFGVSGTNIARAGTPAAKVRANCGVALTSDPAAAVTIL